MDSFGLSADAATVVQSGRFGGFEESAGRFLRNRRFRHRRGSVPPRGGEKLRDVGIRAGIGIEKEDMPVGKGLLRNFPPFEFIYRRRSDDIAVQFDIRVAQTAFDFLDGLEEQDLRTVGILVDEAVRLDEHQPLLLTIHDP